MDTLFTTRPAQLQPQHSNLIPSITCDKFSKYKNLANFTNMSTTCLVPTPGATARTPFVISFRKTQNSIASGGLPSRGISLGGHQSIQEFAAPTSNQTTSDRPSPACTPQKPDGNDSLDSVSSTGRGRPEQGTLSFGNDQNVPSCRSVEVPWRRAAFVAPSLPADT